MNAAELVKRIKCDRCARQARTLVLFIGNAELLMCFQCLGPEGGVIRDRIADEGGTILEIEVDAPLFPGMKMPVPNSTKRPTLSETRCPKCNSGQTYVRAGGIDGACRACSHIWPVASLPEQRETATDTVVPISPALKAKELEAREQQKRDLQAKLRAESHRRALCHPSMTDTEYMHLTRQYVELCQEDDEGRAAA